MKIVLLLLISLNAFALNRPEVFVFGRNNIFFEERRKDLYLNKSCKDEKCLAFKLTKEKIKFPKLKGYQANPTSYTCKNELKGTVIIGRDLKGNEQSFCRLSDKSMILLNSAIY